MTMRKALVLALVLALSLPTLVEASRRKSPLERSIFEDFPAAPTTLDSEPGATGMLLLHTAIAKLAGFKVVGAILERRHDGKLIRASCFTKNLVLFHELEPGSYALRLIKLKDLMGDKATLTSPEGGGSMVDVKPGALHSLGVVRVRVRTIFNSGIEIRYDPASELAAWQQFKEAFAGSPWVGLVRERVASNGAGAKPRTSPVANEPSPPD